MLLLAAAATTDAGRGFGVAAITVVSEGVGFFSGAAIGAVASIPFCEQGHTCMTPVFVGMPVGGGIGAVGSGATGGALAARAYGARPARVAMWTLAVGGAAGALVAAGAVTEDEGLIAVGVVGGLAGMPVVAGVLTGTDEHRVAPGRLTVSVHPAVTRDGGVLRVAVVGF